MKLLRFCLVIFLLVVSGRNAFATHNRAGEITYESVGGSVYHYKITITTYTKTSSVNVDRPRLDSVYLGDDPIHPVVFYRASQIFLPDDITKNIYYYDHTYSGAGDFLIYFSDPNRNEGVINIPNS